MINSTNAGYKVTLQTSIAGVKDQIDSTTSFFNELQQEGIWFAISGKHFKELVIDSFVYLVNFAVEMSDVLVIIAMIELVFIMFGSVRARKHLYWTVAFYLIFKICGVLL